MSCFKEFKAFSENQSGQKLKILRTDNGTAEYINHEMSIELKKCGILHQTTVPYTPEQNGISERVNRTIVEKARCMLNDAGLGKQFWAEAVNTAVYIINRSPHKRLSKTPEEIWTGVKPSLDHLKCFGCLAMSHIPKQKRTKWDPKTKRCFLMGYSETSKGYRLYNPKNRTVFVSRDVTFMEQQFIKDNEEGAVPGSSTINELLSTDIVIETENNNVL